MHGANLMGTEGLAEQVDGRHLASKDALFVDVGSRADVAFVERLKQSKLDCEISGFWWLPNI